MRKFFGMVLGAMAALSVMPLAVSQSQASYVFQFTPTSVVGPFPLPDEIMISDVAFDSGRLVFSYNAHVGSINPDLERFTLGARSLLITGQGNPGFEKLVADFIIVDRHLTGSFQWSDSSLTEQAQGAVQSGVEWLVGRGSDGTPCLGSQDPTDTEGPLGTANRCRATGTWDLVGHVPEPGTALVLLSALLAIGAIRRRFART